MFNKWSYNRNPAWVEWRREVHVFKCKLIAGAVKWLTLSPAHTKWSKCQYSIFANNMQTGKNTKAISKGRKQISLSSALTTIHTQSNTYSCLQNPCQITAPLPIIFWILWREGNMQWQPCSVNTIGYACLWILRYKNKVKSADHDGFV